MPFALYVIVRFKRYGSIMKGLFKTGEVRKISLMKKDLEWPLLRGPFVARSTHAVLEQSG